MSVDRSDEFIISLIQELLKQPNETEWLEFKHNNKTPQLIGEYISALSNSAALNGKTNAYMVWGIDDKTHKILGTTFKPSVTKNGGEALENWLLRLLEPKIDFKFYEVKIDDNDVVLLEIAPAYRHPVRFNGVEYIRLSSHKKKLKELPEKERELWRVFDKIPFEKQVAVDNLDESEVLGYLEYVSYFDLIGLPLPENRKAIIESLESNELICKSQNGKYSITNLGAILFAKDLYSFNHLRRKAIRVIQYKDNSKLETIKEKEIRKGYAVGFEGLIEYINSILPSNEVIGKAFRKTIQMYPELSIRELVANAIIHQDFSQTGNSVMIEIYSNRIEITNPGEPLVDTDRFLDTPPKSRNEILASFMRRINICEERGSGVDKVVAETELYQLPAPIFRATNGYTISILFAHKELKDMNRLDRVRACYLHCCLRYIQNDFMTNTSLRERFGIEVKNRSMVSKIINETIKDGKIVIYDDTVGTKAREYIPSWAK
ncbi:ATP-binding protein [Hydrogenimonas thermophila]|uniref:Predicted transcriptional regulator, contains HTH domain n=1 Tax=Hydrogenimonas thermophila TaxID=223786 RepID=A0A1I5TTE6_9BACT|nr:ATP-binding protein [Hydrogenimonas thermophila]SFP86340.1 Predicted transcriptional regulator, contains HTH domain [Hydrogenimonas thermophila]